MSDHTVDTAEQSKKTVDAVDEKEVEMSEQGASRRGFLKSSAYLGTLGAAGVLGNTVLAGSASAEELTAAELAAVETDASVNIRTQRAFKIRVDAAIQHRNYTQQLPDQLNNSDEARYSEDRYYASFTKVLPHNQYGEVAPGAYRALLRAMATRNPNHFDAIPLAQVADRKLANPQGAFRIIFSGLDGHATRMRPAPVFRGAEAAAEMGELYWQALTRDVPFNHYGFNSDIAHAVTDLNNFLQPVGPKDGGVITPATLFRGPTPGDLNGPYVSQFLWQNVPYGSSVIEQRYEKPVAQDFMLDETNWLNIQRGGSPLESPAYDPTHRYLYDNRGLGEYVHRDVLFQAYFNASLILLGFGGAAMDPNNPYFNGDIVNQGAFTSLGGPYVIDMVTQAANLALQGAWYQKWSVHRRLRPETFGGRIHFQQTALRPYEIHPDILASDAINEAYSRNGTYMLPMAYTEGSPTHPAYPAGHATIAGACSTVLKAFFNEDFVIPAPVVANDDGSGLNSYSGPDLTVGGELNKLASNIAIARNAAGVHYRSDGEDGLLVGEQQAIALLQDYSRGLRENFNGFTLTKFDGSTILIQNGEVFAA